MADKTLREIINSLNPNTLADALRTLKFGNFLLQHCRRALRSVVPVLATGRIALPEWCKANTVVSAYARSTSAAGTLGALTVVAGAPADGQIAVGANGDILVAAASAYTAVDVIYEPEPGEVVELDLPVAANVINIPAVYQPVAVLLEANVTAGTATGDKTVLAPAAGAPAAGNARLDVAKDTVQFAAADGATRAIIKFIQGHATDLLAPMVAKTDILG
jgi:hypothetical protein